MLTVASNTLALALCHHRQDSPGGKAGWGRWPGEASRIKGRAVLGGHGGLPGWRLPLGGLGPSDDCDLVNLRNSRLQTGLLLQHGDSSHLSKPNAVLD